MIWYIANAVRLQTPGITRILYTCVYDACVYDAEIRIHGINAALDTKHFTINSGFHEDTGAIRLCFHYVVLTRM